MDMYNRYIPQPDGSYRRNRIQEPHKAPPPKPQQPPCLEKPEPPCRQPPAPPPPKCPAPCPKERCAKSKKECQPTGTDLGSFFKKLLPKDFDTADLLIVLLLLLMAGDCPEDQNTALLTLALYMFL